MYSREISSQLRQQFWTSFGRYMAPVLSAEGEKVNWINYKTGEKGFRFLMDADNKGAEIFIELSHNDPGIRELYFDQLIELKGILHGTVGEEWTWTREITDKSGRQISKVGITLPGVSVFRQEDWPGLIRFFKPRIIALDEFWSNARIAFEQLR